VRPGSRTTVFKTHSTLVLSVKGEAPPTLEAGVALTRLPSMISRVMLLYAALTFLR
jgi:hypothetical protein